MANPTGEQFELTRGNARAVITEIGSGLRVFEINGVPYLETFDADAEPPQGAGQVLLPWPDPSAGEQRPGDAQQDPAATQPQREDTLPGLAGHREWELLEHAESSIALAVDLGEEAAGPSLRAMIVYDLAPRGLTVTYEVRNEGEQPVAFGMGSRPYFRIAEVPTDELTLTVSATRMRPGARSERLSEEADREVVDPEHDLRYGRVVGGLDIDAVFGGLVAAADGRHHHLLTHGDTTVDVWTDPDFRWVGVRTLPDLVGRGRALAIEPLTSPADALLSGTDLLHLHPGASWRAGWGIHVEIHPEFH